MDDLLKLNRKTPFVNAIFRLALEEAPREVAMSEAVQVLRVAEERHGVTIMRESGPEVHDLLRLTAGGKVLELRGILEIIHAKPYRQSPFMDPNLIDEEEALCERHLFPFISETQFLVNGRDFCNDHCFLFRNGQFFKWGACAWGHIMARWYNKRTGKDLCPSAPSSSYVEFEYYYGTEDKEYQIWLPALLSVLKAKWEGTLATLE